jgi:acetyltransferase-like isoleucine patch superfamily enzyme
VAWLTREQIQALGITCFGDDVLISDRASIHGGVNMRLGNHVRIDDFAILTAKEPVVIGSYCHISARVFLGGTYGIEIGDFVNISVGCSVFSACDDCSGSHLIGPTVPDRFRGVANGKVVFGDYSGVGANSVVFPGVHFPEGSGIGALTLAHKSLEAWTYYLGVPMRKLKRRSTRLKDFAAELLAK